MITNVKVIEIYKNNVFFLKIKLPEIFSEITIGRGIKNDIILDEDYVSYEHASVKKDNLKYFFTDKKSSNGSYVSGKSVKNETVELSLNDYIKIYNFLFLFKEEHIEPNKGTQFVETKCEDDRQKFERMKKEFIIFNGMPMEEPIKDFINFFSNSKGPLLIFGEAGTGKELLAKAIHKVIYKKEEEYDFIHMRCFETEEEGQFWEYLNQANEANNATLFLDNIHNIKNNKKIRAELFRIIQEKRFKTLSGDYKSVNFMIIATSINRKFISEFKQEDENLYDPLDALSITIPPLRERGKDDIDLLVNHFLDIYGKKYNNKCKFTKRAMDFIYKFKWPGNVKQMEGIIERFCLTSKQEVDRIDLFYLFEPDKEETLKESGTIEDIKRKIFIQSHKKNGGIEDKVSKELGISRATFYRYQKDYFNDE